MVKQGNSIAGVRSRIWARGQREREKQTGGRDPAVTLSWDSTALPKSHHNDLKIITETTGTASLVALALGYFSDCKTGGLAPKWENQALQSSNNCKSSISFGKH